jgi:hypothetical protein
VPQLQAPPPLPKSQPLFLKRISTVIKLCGVGALILVMLQRREVEEMLVAAALKSGGTNFRDNFTCARKTAAS